MSADSNVYLLGVLWQVYEYTLKLLSSGMGGVQKVTAFNFNKFQQMTADNVKVM